MELYSFSISTWGFQKSIQASRRSLPGRPYLHGGYATRDFDTQYLTIEFCTNLHKVCVIPKRNPTLEMSYSQIVSGGLVVAAAESVLKHSPPPFSHESATTCNTLLRFVANVIPSLANPGNRTVSLYSVRMVSTSIQQSGGGGAWLKKGPGAAVGERIIGGSGAGYRTEKSTESF